jgi:tetratricopeptide (TPR) repeat protein
MNTPLAIRVLLLFALPFASAARAADSDRETAYRYGVQARLAEMNGKYDDAIALYDKALALDPKDAISYNARGNLKKEYKEDFKGAIADYDKAIALKPANDIALIYANRGDAKQRSGDLDGAIADFDRVIAATPDDAVVYNNRAFAKYTKGDLEGAIKDYSKAITLDPKEVTFYKNRAGAKQAKGDDAGAVADFDSAVAVEPDNVRLLYDRGNAKRVMGNLDAAIADYDKAIALKPDVNGLHIARGNTLEAKGDFKGALTEYNRALGDDPIYVLFYRELVLHRLQQPGTFAEMAKTVAKWKDGWPKTIGLYVVEAVPESAFLAKAEQGADDARLQQKCEAFYFAGVTHLLADDKEGARKLLEQCVATKQRDNGEWVMARAELSRLDDKR